MPLPATGNGEHGNRLRSGQGGKSPVALCKCRSTQPSLHLWCSPGSGLVPSSGQYIFLFFLSTYTPCRPPTLTYTGKAPKYAQMGPIADDSSSCSDFIRDTHWLFVVYSSVSLTPSPAPSNVSSLFSWDLANEQHPDIDFVRTPKKRSKQPTTIQRLQVQDQYSR